MDIADAGHCSAEGTYNGCHKKLEEFLKPSQCDIQITRHAGNINKKTNFDLKDQSIFETVFSNGLSYRGHQNKTIRGYTCQHWSS